MFVAGCRSANPAKLVGTQPTLHVVAPIQLLDLSSTHGAELDVEVLFRGPFFELVLQVGLTRGEISVPGLPTTEAYPSETDVAL